MSDRSHLSLFRATQAITRRALGTARNVTLSCSPTYSPSTWSATGRSERSVKAGWSCRLTTSRPRGDSPSWVNIWRSAFNVPIVRIRRSAKMSSPASKLAPGLGLTGLSAQVGPGRRVGENAEEQVPERGFAVPFQGEPGVAAVGDPVELAQRGPQVQAWGQAPAVLAHALDHPHRLGVQAHPGVKGEVAIQAGSRGGARTGVAGTGTAQADALGPRPVRSASRIRPVALHRVGGQAQCAAEHVGVAARDGERSPPGPSRASGRAAGR